MEEFIKEKTGRSPWMYVSVLLGILLVVSMGFNFSVTTSIINGNIQAYATGGTVATTPSPPTTTPPNPSSGSIRVSADDDAVLGNPNAPVTIIEFSDFQCPFCRRSFTQMLPQLESEYINTDKVKFVYRDFPLSFHPASQPSAESAECAEDQGKFWEMHDKIFEEQNKLGAGTVEFSADDIKRWASEIGLNAQEFNSCLDSGKYTQEVLKDFSDGSASGVSGTPTFFIGNDQNGYQKIVGAQPYEAFKPIIDSYIT